MPVITVISKIYMETKLMSTLPCNHSESVVKWVIWSYKIKILLILMVLFYSEDLIILTVFPGSM